MYKGADNLMMNVMMEMPVSFRSRSSLSSSFAPSIIQPRMTGSDVFPFSSHFSAKVCLTAAFNIADSFQNLPLPYQYSALSSSSRMPADVTLSDSFFGQTHISCQGPRMVPITACCAMQSIYAMTLMSVKVREKKTMMAERGQETIDHAIKKMCTRLEDSSRTVLDVLRNFTIAYEALEGMRGT